MHRTTIALIALLLLACGGRFESATDNVDASDADAANNDASTDAKGDDAIEGQTKPVCHVDGQDVECVDGSWYWGDIAGRHWRCDEVECRGGFFCEIADGGLGRCR